MRRGRCRPAGISRPTTSPTAFELSDAEPCREHNILQHAVSARRCGTCSRPGPAYTLRVRACGSGRSPEWSKGNSQLGNAETRIRRLKSDQEALASLVQDLSCCSLCLNKTGQRLVGCTVPCSGGLRDFGRESPSTLTFDPRLWVRSASAGSRNDCCTPAGRPRSSSNAKRGAGGGRSWRGVESQVLISFRTRRRPTGLLPAASRGSGIPSFAFLRYLSRASWGAPAAQQRSLLGLGLTSVKLRSLAEKRATATGGLGRGKRRYKPTSSRCWIDSVGCPSLGLQRCCLRALPRVPYPVAYFRRCYGCRYG